jgi:hypothetical protein
VHSIYLLIYIRANKVKNPPLGKDFFAHFNVFRVERLRFTHDYNKKSLKGSKNFEGD